MIRDISAIDYTGRSTVRHPQSEKACKELKHMTNARICVGRAGTGYQTENYLRYLADHAAAMDSVWAEVNDSLLEQWNFYKVETCARTKEIYIKRPDLGRKFSTDVAEKIKNECIHHADVQILVADGLSAYAVNENVPDMYEILTDGLQAEGYMLGTPIFIRHGRVGAMDHISELLKSKITVLLIGERPGLITNKSLSCYMAYEASTEKPESQRTVVSNIYRDGTPPMEAAAQIVQICSLMMKEKKSGAELKLV